MVIQPDQEITHPASVNTAFARGSNPLKIMAHMHWGDVIMYRDALSDSREGKY